MARRRLEKKNTRKLIRLGKSVAVTLPIDMVRKLKWRKGQKVVAKLRGKKITIEDWPVRPIRRTPLNVVRGKQGKQAQGKPVKSRKKK